jgi:hypothetical protein
MAKQAMYAPKADNNPWRIDDMKTTEQRLQIALWYPFSLRSLIHPRVAQRAALSAKGASRARSMLALLPGKGSEIALPSGSRRVRKDAFKPDSR